LINGLVKISSNKKYHQVFKFFLMDEELISSRGSQCFVVVGNNILVVHFNIFILCKIYCKVVDHSQMATNHVFVSCRGSGRVAN